MADDEKPWFAPGYAATHAAPVYTPHLRESVWTLTKHGKRVDAELLFHGESYGWECQFLHDGVMAKARRFVLKVLALEEAEAQRHGPGRLALQGRTHIRGSDLLLSGWNCVE
jgi:hypothetical protein